MHIFIIIMFLFAGVQGAGAFGVVTVFGQGAEHEKITRLALKKFDFGKDTLDKLAGKKGLFGAVGAPDRPDRGLLNNPDVHCDGGDYFLAKGYPQTAKQANAQLERCRQIIFRSLGSAVKTAAEIADKRGNVDLLEIPKAVPCGFNGQSGRAKCDVLEALGMAFHASQDFYAHTNWTDVPAPGPNGPLNPIGLGATKPSPSIDPGRRAVFPAGLISGCFEGLPERRRCFYGNKQNRVRHKILNKDIGSINVKTGAIGKGATLRGSINGNFKRAVTAAILDTRAKWKFFESQVISKYGALRGKVIICAVKSDNELACGR